MIEVLKDITWATEVLSGPGGAILLGNNCCPDCIVMGQ